MIGALRGSLAPLVLGFCFWLLFPAESLARALVRFVHAVPGAGRATAEVDFGSGETKLGSIGFGQATPWRSVRSGRFHWTLVGGGGKPLAQGTSTIGSGSYDVVVLARAHGIGLGIYRAQAGRRGTSLVRVVHAAPELGSPELELDSRLVDRRLNFTQATPYLSVDPGMHSLSALRPGDSAPLISIKGVKLTPDVAYSAVIIGSRGQMVRVVTVTDRGAPLTRTAAARPGSRAAGVATTGTWITVRPGDSLWRIARQVIGGDPTNQQIQRELAAIWDENAKRIGTGDPNLIFPGQRLRVPRGQA